MIVKNVVLAILFACILCSCKSDKPEAPQSDTVEDIYTFADKLCGKGDYVEAAKWLLIAAEH